MRICLTNQLKTLCNKTSFYFFNLFNISTQIKIKKPDWANINLFRVIGTNQSRLFGVFKKIAYLLKEKNIKKEINTNIRSESFKRL